MFPTYSSPQMAASKLVRFLWADFERWLAAPRAAMERQRDELLKEQDAKWRAAPARSRAKKEDHEAHKMSLRRELEEDHFTVAREEWQNRLQKANLKDEDWNVMTEAETRAVERALGGEEEAAENVASSTQSRSNTVGPTPAPVISAAGRTANLSSGYTFVSPADFGTDDELFEAVSSYIVPTDEDVSDDEPTSVPIPTHHSKEWGTGVPSYNTWGVESRSSNYSSQTGSPDQPPLGSFGADYITYAATQARTREPTTAPPKRPPDLNPKVPAKPRLPGPSYIGPQLCDPDEASDEEADFERFKMQTRVAKILEFHHAAAQADIDLAINIYNERKARKSGKSNDALKVVEHQKQMVMLQAEKEEERKAIVATERKKRRDEIRRRSALRDSSRAANTMNTPSWGGLFDSQAVRIELDMSGKLALRREDASHGDPENQTWSEYTSSLESIHAPAQADVLRGRKQSLNREATPVVTAKQSGWKTKQTSTTLPSWQTVSSDTLPHVHDRVEEAPWLSSKNPLAQPIALENQDIQIPGGFPVEAKPTPVPAASGWGKRAPAVPLTQLASKISSAPMAEAGSSLKLSQGEASVLSKPLKSKLGKVSPPPDTTTSNKASPPAESKPHSVPAPAPPPAPAPSKKLNKKQRQASKKTGPAVKNEAESSPLPPVNTEPPQTPDVANSQTTLSTPRPGMSNAKRQTAVPDLSSGGPSTKFEDVASTPRPGAMKNSTHSIVANGLAGSALEEESPWNRMMRKKAQALEPQGSSLAKAALLSFEDEESPWARLMRQQAQAQAPEPRLANPPKAAALADAEEEETPWARLMKKQAQMQGTAGPSKMGTLDQTSHSSTSTSGLRPNNPEVWVPPGKTPWTTLDLDRPISKLVQPSVRPTDRDYWTPGGNAAGQGHHQTWNPSAGSRSPQIEKSTSMPLQHTLTADAQRVRRMSDPVSPSPRGFGFVDLPDVGQRREFVPASILKKTKSKKANKGKRVTIEDVSDEEGVDGRKPPDAKLPSDSRVILDIVEPKPSVPSTMFSSIFQYGEDGDDEETESSSMVPTPSTAPTSPPSETSPLDDEWFATAAEEIKKGTADWEKLIDGQVSNGAAGVRHARWKLDPPTNEPLSSQAFGGAKTFTKFELFDDSPPSSSTTQASLAAKPSAPVPQIRAEPAGRPGKEAKEKEKGKGKGAADKKGKR